MAEKDLSKAVELESNETIKIESNNKQNNLKRKEKKDEVEEVKRFKWSAARKKAYLKRHENPNAYYYRFNAPGEEQRTGPWTEEEENKLLDMIRNGHDYRWGLMSMRISGRVGYQCSNYYRKLISEGKIIDPNYQVDGDGKLSFIFKSQREEDAQYVKPIIVKEQEQNVSSIEDKQITSAAIVAPPPPPPPPPS